MTQGERFSSMQSIETVKSEILIDKSTTIRFILLLTLWAAAFYPILPGLFKTWISNSNNSHGILVPFIALYFIWRRKDQLSKTSMFSSYWGGVLLFLSMAIYLISYLGGVAVLARLMIVFSLIGLVIFTLGREIFMLLLFPILFLFFMIPIPDSIVGIVAFPLQLLATKFAYYIINALQIPVHREGNMLYFAQTQLEVAEACSGIRSILALTMLGTIFAYLSNSKMILRLILVASAIPIAFACNIARVSITGILAHFYGSEVARGFLHEFSGLVVFGLGLLVFMAEYSLIKRMGER